MKVVAFRDVRGIKMQSGRARLRMPGLMVSMRQIGKYFVTLLVHDHRAFFVIAPQRIFRRVLNVSLQESLTV